MLHLEVFFIAEYKLLRHVTLYLLVVTCVKPTIENASITPTSDSIAVTESYMVSCDGDYSLLGNETMKCNEDGTLSMAPACFGL